MINYSLYPTLLDSFYWAKRLGKWQELIDKINGVKPVELPDVVNKGTCFEQTVNNLLNGVYVRPGENCYINTQYNFDKKLTDRVVAKLANNQGQQQFIKGQLLTPMGNVELYGYVDYVYPEMYVDLKTTSKYMNGKYSINAQHKCYPIISNKKGLTYLVTDFTNLYTESYTLTPELKDIFIYELVEFLQWAETNRDKLTSKRLFGK